MSEHEGLTVDKPKSIPERVSVLEVRQQMYETRQKEFRDALHDIKEVMPHRDDVFEIRNEVKKIGKKQDSQNEELLKSKGKTEFFEKYSAVFVTLVLAGAGALIWLILRLNNPEPVDMQLQQEMLQTLQVITEEYKQNHPQKTDSV